MRTALPVTSSLLLLISAGVTTPQDLPSREPTPSPFRISVDLNLVVLPVTVRDRKGGFAADLNEHDFQVYEDGVRQSVHLFRHEDIPVTVGLVIDHSGSMRRKLDDVVAAAQSFVKLSNEDDEMFAVNFNEHVSLGLPPSSPFTNRADEMEAAILNTSITGQTALYDAMNVALDQLKLGHHEKKVLIVISDGGDNASKQELSQVLKKAVGSGAILYTIGIFEPDDPDQNAPVLRRLAKETGGDAFFPAQFSDAVSICQDIAKDIRHQYTLGYVSASTRSGGRRALRVVAKAAGKDLVVRTRAGYIAAETTTAAR